MEHEVQVKIGQENLVVKKESDGPIAGVYENGTDLKATDFSAPEQSQSLADLTKRVYILEVARSGNETTLRNTHPVDSFTGSIVGPDNSNWVRTIFPNERIIVPSSCRQALIISNDRLVTIVQKAQMQLYVAEPKIILPPNAAAPPQNALKELQKEYDSRFMEQVDLFIEKMGIKDGAQYRKEYWAGKTELNWRSGQVFRENRKLPRALLADFLVKVHTRLDELKYESLSENTVSQNSAEELRGVAEIYQGDFLPGRSFVLGQQMTYNRELLQISRKSPLVHNALMESRMLAGRTQYTTSRILAQDIFADFQEKYAEGQDDDLAEGIAKTIGGFMEDGGCCRHRSAALALVLQEAGIQARYVQGFHIGRPHAWVHVVEGGIPVMLFDPNMRWDKNKQRGEEYVIDRAELKKEDDLWKYFVYSWPEHTNTIWRAKPNF